MLGVSASLISEGARGLLASLVLRGCPRVGLQGDIGPVMHSPRMQHEAHGNGSFVLHIFRLI